MVDIWSFGMVILELVTQQIPYSECKGAFQAYQAIISGTKPLVLSQISNPYIRSLIDICLNVSPTCRPTALELLSHPFLLSRGSDKTLCHKGIKPKSATFPPEPPKSPLIELEAVSPVSEIAESVDIGSLSEEQIVVETVDVLDANKTKITMQIFHFVTTNYLQECICETQRGGEQALW